MSPAAKSSRVSSLRQRPLLLHLGMATAALAVPELQQGEVFDDAFWRKPKGQTIRSSMEKTIQGIRLYQTHSYERAPMRQSIVWSDGSARLVWYAAKTRKPKARVLVIPSMINGPEIMDIMPDRSLLRWLSAQGFDVYLLEWGNLRDDPELASLDHALGTKLKKAVDWLGQDKGDPLFGLGYCMGGLFLAAAERLAARDCFAGLCFVATPWDFKAGAKGSFAEAVTRWADDGLPQVAHIDNMPSQWLQMIFAGVDPGLIARKYSAFADMDQTGPDAELFVAVEDWVNGGPDLPAGVAQQAVRGWYLENKPVKGTWTVAGRRVNARKITTPSLVIVPSRDKIVPPASAQALVDQIPDVWVLTPECGHISMMVGRSARRDVWGPMKDWIQDRIRDQS